MTDEVVANYFIDETGFSFEDDSDAAISEAFTEFASLLEHVREEGGHIHHVETIWDIVTSSGRPLTELLYTPSGIDEVARRLLYGLLQKSHSSDMPPEPGEIVSDSTSTLPASAGVTLCAVDVRQQKPASVLTTIQSTMRGDVIVRLERGNDQIHTYLITTEDGFKHFWRRVPEACDIPIHAVGAVASRAFPKSSFLDGVWVGAKEFEGDEATNRRILVRHLAGLDDHFLSIYASTNDPNRISTEMGSRAGVDCSKESNKTRRNSKAMAARIRSHGGQDIVFEWHTKFEAHRNRIHFAVVDGNLCVGIFCRHLDT